MGVLVVTGRHRNNPDERFRLQQDAPEKTQAPTSYFGRAFSGPVLCAMLGLVALFVAGIAIKCLLSRSCSGWLAVLCSLCWPSAPKWPSGVKLLVQNAQQWAALCVCIATGAMELVPVAAYGGLRFPANAVMAAKYWNSHVTVAMARSSTSMEHAPAANVVFGSTVWHASVRACAAASTAPLAWGKHTQRLVSARNVMISTTCSATAAKGLPITATSPARARCDAQFNEVRQTFAFLAVVQSQRSLSVLW